MIDYFNIMLTIIIVLVCVIFLQYQLWQNLQKKYEACQFSKQSQSVKYGQMSEQFMPFLKDYPYDSQEFKFIGKPIDGIQFEPDKIIFIEFKTNKSRMSDKQFNIKEIIEKGNVEFKELRM